MCSRCGDLQIPGGMTVTCVHSYDGEKALKLHGKALKAACMCVLVYVSFFGGPGMAVPNRRSA
jgi:hypothetical protein